MPAQIGILSANQRALHVVTCKLSVGHRTDLDNACAHTLALTPKYRLPETTRRADALCRRALQEATIRH